MSKSQQDHNQQVAKHWASVAERQELGFWNVPGWFEHQNLLGSGDAKKTWLDLFHDKLKKEGITPGHALSLGCGAGSLEREMVARGLCQTVEGCDISPNLLKMASDMALEKKLPINYYVADLNNPSFSPKTYNLIIGAGIFHHVDNLEGLFSNLRQSLKLGGKLLVYDYVGPSRFQWTQQQIKYCNRWLKSLPKKFKRKQGYPSHYYVAKALFDCLPFSHSEAVEKWFKKWLPQNFYLQFLRLKTAQIQMEQLIAPHPDQFLVTDPSEAIRSNETISVLKNYFEIDCLVPQGGTLVQPLFGRTVANFIQNNEGALWVEKILAEERELIQNGELPSDFIALMATAKSCKQLSTKVESFMVHVMRPQ